MRRRIAGAAHRVIAEIPRADGRSQRPRAHGGLQVEQDMLFAHDRCAADLGAAGILNDNARRKQFRRIAPAFGGNAECMERMWRIRIASETHLLRRQRILPRVDEEGAAHEAHALAAVIERKIGDGFSKRAVLPCRQKKTRAGRRRNAIDGGGIAVIEHPARDIHRHFAEIPDLDPLVGVGTDGICKDFGNEDGGRRGK